MIAYLPIIGALFAAAPAMAHMQLSKPYPLRSEFDPINNSNNIDYSMTNPLKSDGSDFPCKGYQKDKFRAAATYAAGNAYGITIAGSTTHGGGSCQISLSYDNGATFKVIESMLGGCPLTSNYDFVVPEDAPGGQALLAWTWFNLSGNREMYMNCAQVEVTNAAGNAGKFSALPDMFVANVGKGCTTIEGKHTVFANPGKEVVYGSGVTSSSPVNPVCKK